MLLGDITDSILVVGTLLMPRFVVFCFICSMEKHFLLSDEKIDFKASLLPASSHRTGIVLVNCPLSSPV